MDIALEVRPTSTESDLCLYSYRKIILNCPQDGKDLEALHGALDQWVDLVERELPTDMDKGKEVALLLAEVAAHHPVRIPITTCLTALLVALVPSTGSAVLDSIADYYMILLTDGHWAHCSSLMMFLVCLTRYKILKVSLILQLFTLLLKGPASNEMENFTSFVIHSALTQATVEFKEYISEISYLLWNQPLEGVTLLSACAVGMLEELSDKGLWNGSTTGNLGIQVTITKIPLENLILEWYPYLTIETISEEREVQFLSQLGIDIESGQKSLLHPVYVVRIPRIVAQFSDQWSIELTLSMLYRAILTHTFLGDPNIVVASCFSIRSEKIHAVQATIDLWLSLCAHGCSVQTSSFAREANELMEDTMSRIRMANTSPRYYTTLITLILGTAEAPVKIARSYLAGILSRLILGTNSHIFAELRLAILTHYILPAFPDVGVEMLQNITDEETKNSRFLKTLRIVSQMEFTPYEEPLRSVIRNITPPWNTTQESLWSPLLEINIQGGLLEYSARVALGESDKPAIELVSMVWRTFLAEHSPLGSFHGICERWLTGICEDDIALCMFSNDQFEGLTQLQVESADTYMKGRYSWWPELSPVLLASIYTAEEKESLKAIRRLADDVVIEPEITLPIVDEVTAPSEELTAKRKPRKSTEPSLIKQAEKLDSPKVEENETKPQSEIDTLRSVRKQTKSRKSNLAVSLLELFSSPTYKEPTDSMPEKDGTSLTLQAQGQVLPENQQYITLSTCMWLASFIMSGQNQSKLFRIPFALAAALLPNSSKGAVALMMTAVALSVEATELNILQKRLHKEGTVLYQKVMLELADEESSVPEFTVKRPAFLLLAVIAAAEGQIGHLEVLIYTLLVNKCGTVEDLLWCLQTLWPISEIGLPLLYSLVGRPNSVIPRLLTLSELTKALGVQLKCELQTLVENEILPDILEGYM